MVEPSFEPVAIIGRGCALPGALTPEALWQAIVEGRDLLSAPPEGILGITPDEERALDLRGGFVTGFEDVFNADEHDLGDIDPRVLDPVFQWLLHSGRRAWREAGEPAADASRVGVIIGNLGYPTHAFCDLACDIWTGTASTVHPINRFNTGMPARLLARALGADGPAFALDAACASSLYALKLACDRLQDRSLDVAVAGGVNATDNLILHLGFEALNALSPSGRSRPLVEGGDGLVPAQGAACVVLKRLSDVGTEDRVFGVIRGIGLSNDGCRKGLLVPDRSGQLEAIGNAWAASGLDPSRDIGLIECHATGTPVGDAVEVAATASFFAGAGPLPVGSLKSNLGHLITAAGLAGLLKLCSSFEHETLPPTRLEGEPLKALDDTDLFPITTPLAWPEDRPPIAGLSNFGFGGNNAHLILDAHRGAKRKTRARHTPHAEVDIAVTAIGLIAGDTHGVDAVLVELASPGAAEHRKLEDIEVSPTALRTPPSELRLAQGQQLALFEAVAEALSTDMPSAGNRVGVYVGFGCAPDGARLMLRARIAARLGLDPASLDATRFRDAASASMVAGHVLGAMANISANRLNAMGDWRAEGFSVMAEESSGLTALELAMRALRRGEIDAAIVAAADLSTDSVNVAVRQSLEIDSLAGDAAAALVLRRAPSIGPSRAAPLALLHSVAPAPADGPGQAAFSRRFGVSHAAGGLAELVCRIWLAVHGYRLGADAIAPRLSSGNATMQLRGGEVRLTLQHLPSDDPAKPGARLAYFAADDPKKLAAAVGAQTMGSAGTMRLAIAAADPGQFQERHAAALGALKSGRKPEGPGISFGEGPAEGALAFLFPPAAAAYPANGKNLFAAFPELGAALERRFSSVQDIADLLAGSAEDTLEQLRLGNFLAQAHMIVLHDLLGVRADAAIGLSAGEINALFAFGAWENADGLVEDLARSGTCDRYLGGEFEVAKTYWGDDVAPKWETWHLFAPIPAVRESLGKVSRASLAIIFSPQDCVIAGDAAACRRVLQSLDQWHAVRLRQDLIAHAPVFSPYAEAWHNLHYRETRVPEGVRFYANATNAPYELDAERVADMFTRQALDTVDFSATLRRAFADGVRTMIELGPRDILSHAATETLAPGAVRLAACDRPDQSPLYRIAEVAATLFAAGHRVRIDWLAERIDSLRRVNRPGEAAKTMHRLKLPAHIRPPTFPSPTFQAFPEAPPLPPVDYSPAHRSKPPTPAPSASLPLAPGFRWTPPVGPSTGKPPASEARRAGASGSSAKPPSGKSDPTGPSFDSESIERATYGPVSELFGPSFKEQDPFERQVRLPRRPLLLVDRITGIEAKPGVLGKGTIWTETDIGAHDWAIFGPTMRPGPLIEAGQADLSLISWMGIDKLNRSERVYRLLGCRVTFHEGGLPRPGDTLKFRISITGHAEIGGVRLFFFEYDCHVGDRLVISVRNGQAGFFNEQELADTKGVLWSADEEGPATARPRLARTRPSRKRAFSAADVEAFRRGDTYACFGDGFERTAAHSRPPRLPDGRLALFDDVPVFEPVGGPWGRGYLQARHRVSPLAWFYDGHFHKDPCMPGTLMAEAAVQVLEFTAAALGLTIDCDSHVFEPVAEEAATFVCRGQVIPDRAHEVLYEIFVDEVVGGDNPGIYAALLASCDGVKVFHCPHFGIRLRPHWPRIAPATFAARPRIVGDSGDVRGDEGALLECTSGALSRSFGTIYAPFDRLGHGPRLPQPPYLMVSRVLSVSGVPGEARTGVTAITEYDIPEDAWYFEDGATQHMPFALLVEAVLQPCGWLATFCGFALSGGSFFRNLDGDGTVHRLARPQNGKVRVKTTLTRFSRAGPTTIVFFAVEASLGDGRALMTLETSFGYFTAEMLANQTGLATTADDRAAFDAPNEQGLVEPANALPRCTGRLAVIDRIDSFDPTGGPAALGRIRGRQRVDPRAWYFRAHFFSDPVQPGSLGLDALVQLLAHAAQLKGLAEGFDEPAWEAMSPGARVAWTYRGQVTPDNRAVTTVVDILSIREFDDGSRQITGRGSLWVDGLRIYEMNGIAVRLYDGRHLPKHPRIFCAPSAPAWVGDHCPTYTIPVLPLIGLAGFALDAALRNRPEKGFPVALRDFRVHRWAIVPESGLALEARIGKNGHIDLYQRLGADSLAPWTALAEGRIDYAPQTPSFELEGGPPVEPRPDPYLAAELFHGPELRPVTRVLRNNSGFESKIDLSKAVTAGDPMDPILLDGLVHCVPHDAPEEWFEGMDGRVIYPGRIACMLVLGPVPESGALRVRGRPGTADPVTGELPVLIESTSARGPHVRLEYFEKAYPKGAIGALPRLERRAFLRGESQAIYATLSTSNGATTLLAPSAVHGFDWLPGSVASAYGVPGLAGSELIKSVAVKEHFSRVWKTHPAQIQVDTPFAWLEGRPRARFACRFDLARRQWAVTTEPGG